MPSARRRRCRHRTASAVPNRPCGTPGEVIEALNKAVNAAFTDPAMRARLGPAPPYWFDADVIHNSDYESVDDAKTAIDLYFAERNRHFQEEPRRAGGKIWRKEPVPAEFSESNNCKDPRFG
jgi:hypothetical protein